jgi:hypothetical protein
MLLDLKVVVDGPNTDVQKTRVIVSKKKIGTPAHILVQSVIIMLLHKSKESITSATMPTRQLKLATLLVFAATASLTLAFAPVSPSGCVQRNRFTFASTTEDTEAATAASNDKQLVDVEDNPRKLGLALMLDDGE